MTMKTLLEIPTVGGRGTLPGGIALRYKAATLRDARQFIVHSYNTDAETGTERNYWGGHYCPNLSLALEIVAEKVKRAEGYSGGGEPDIAKLIGFETMAAGEVIASA